MMRLSDAIADKLKGVRSDVEVCKILADNGVNVEEFEKTLSEEELAQVGGGFQKGVAEVHCTNPNCLEAASENISYQFFASLFTDAYYYRCRTCGTYFQMSKFGSLSPWDPNE